MPVRRKDTGGESRWPFESEVASNVVPGTVRRSGDIGTCQSTSFVSRPVSNLFTRRSAGKVLGCLLLCGTVLHGQAAKNPAAPPATGPTRGGTATISLTLADALDRAKANSPVFQAALTQYGLAREDSVQARAALLPGINYNNSFIYTQGNGRHPVSSLPTMGCTNTSARESRMRLSALARLPIITGGGYAGVGQARAEIAARGLVVTVVQLFYGRWQRRIGQRTFACHGRSPALSRTQQEA